VNRGVLFTPSLLAIDAAPPLRAGHAARLRPVEDAALAWRDGSVAFAGSRSDLPDEWRSAPSRQVPGAIVPGFVDCHTHLPFFGWRADEFEARLAGRTYRDLHGGGGIYRSARLLAAASDEDVIEFCRPLAAEMLAHGTTAFELKTGYGLSVEAELRQARLARRLATEVRQRCSVTLLACHAIQEGVSREAWVDAVCRELIPSVASEGLADAVDVYVEDIAFTVADLERVAETAASNGLAVRCHADQLGASGATEAAVRVGARSADHLNNTSDEGVRALGGAPATAATLLPVSTLFIGANRAPAGKLVEADAAIAVATDFNPGTSPCLSVPEAIAASASLYHLPTMVAVVGATANAAWVLGLHERHGRLTQGQRADFVILDSDDLSMLPYRPGHNPVAETWIGGEPAWRREDGAVRPD
jgi:imidazolonepropionase